MEACPDPRSALAWATILALLAAVVPSAAAGGGCAAEYVGGTLGQLGSRVSGRIHITDPEVLLFETKKTGIEIPYDRINLLEYGQQAGRRYLLALAISPLLLFSKSRKHFMTVSFKDEAGQQQAMVFQVDKRDVRAVLAGLEARTGLKVEYQDDEARKAGGG
ncbi:MAG TPA: hypothetical protein VLH09_10980 [Bryobacteraceae bacterium]|nr:hypothetical protein [Bryobacteraceae bacterium]